MEKENQNKHIINILKLVIIAIIGFAFMMMVFGVGIWVGQKRAEFSFRWAENYHRNFGGPRQGIFGNFPAQDFINSHGVFGSVIKIEGNDLIIKGQDNMEKIVVVSAGTTIRNNVKTLLISDVKAGDSVIVIGSPNNQGQVEAKFIRVLLPALSGMSRSPSAALPN